jgi:hypothetical protein
MNEFVDEEVAGIYAANGAQIVETDCGFYPPNLADARLIAAAPDMYDLLKSVQQRVHQAYHEGEPAGCSKGVCADIRAAIAKAEGES